MSIGKLKRVHLREVWKHEAHDFTVWLQNNLDVLSDVLDFEVVTAEREYSVGAFNVDLVGEDASGRTIIIENQLEKTDHKHLGQILTYLAMLDASAAIWIVKEGRTEHIKAMNWLLEHTQTDFYLIQIEAVRIGNSKAAPLLTKIVGPSEEAKQIGKIKQERSERELLRFQYWTRLLEYMKTKSNFFDSKSPGIKGYLTKTSGIKGFYFGFDLRRHDSNAHLYVDTGDEESTQQYYQALKAHQKVINTAIGKKMEWQDLEGKRAFRIRCVCTIGGYRDEEKYDAIIADVVDSMLKIVEVCTPYLENIGKES